MGYQTDANRIDVKQNLWEKDIIPWADIIMHIIALFKKHNQQYLHTKLYNFIYLQKPSENSSCECLVSCCVYSKGFIFYYTFYEITHNFSLHLKRVSWGCWWHCIAPLPTGDAPPAPRDISSPAPDVLRHHAQRLERLLNQPLLCEFGEVIVGMKS